MRFPRRRRAAISMVELLIAVVVAAVVMLFVAATWEMGWRQIVVARERSRAADSGFVVLRRIEQEVMRARTIEVPDPDYAGAPSIQLTVPVGSSEVRRAFRLVGDELMQDQKDEGIEPFAAFEDVQALEFTILDAEATTVEITCTAARNGRTIDMRTTARKRN